MKTNILCVLAATCALSQAAVTVTSTGSNTTALGNTDITLANGDIDFESFNAGTGSDQGSGITINTSDSITPTVGEDLYFQFNTPVAEVETNFFYGQSTTQVNSANASRSDQNAFSVGIDDNGNVFARENGNNLLDFTSLQGLATGTNVQFDIVLSTSIGINFTYEATASYFDTVSNSIITETISNISGNQNGQGNVSNYDFFAVGTTTRDVPGGESFSVDGFTFSDMPIPEPSSSVMIALAGSLLMLRRRRA